MKIPPVLSLGRFVMQKQKCNSNQKLHAHPPLKQDSVTFSASTAYYLKKYNTLPDEIKRILTPKDAIDMFRNMEMVQRGTFKGVTIGEGAHSKVYDNPWLEGYHFLVAQDYSNDTQIIYSRYTLGDSVWSDDDNQLIQIIKAG